MATDFAQFRKYSLALHVLDLCNLRRAWYGKLLFSRILSDIPSENFVHHSLSAGNAFSCDGDFELVALTMSEESFECHELKTLCI